MGTRYLICIYHKGKFVLAQPSGQGRRILAFLSKPGIIALLKSKLPNLWPLTERENAMNEKEAGIAECDCDHLHSSKFVDPTPFSLNRDAGAAILDLIVASTFDDRLLVFLRLEFWSYEGSVLYAYNIDFDSEVLEVYGNRGAAGDELGKGGRLNLCNPYRVSEVAKWRLSELPEWM
ncbi:hypothetical protein LTR95_003063 [Oleoguttula sp. CCFEE 5521]